MAGSINTYTHQMDALFNFITTQQANSYYEYYDKNGNVIFSSVMGKRPQKQTEMSKTVHLHLDNPGQMDDDYMIMVYSIIAHGSNKKKWKISSEGKNANNAAKASIFDDVAKTIAEKNNWKYIALGVANGSPTLPNANVMQDYVVAIESYDCSSKTVHTIDGEIQNLIKAGCPRFMRFSCNNLSMSFVKKDYLCTYLSVFDNRPFQKCVFSTVRYISTPSVPTASPAKERPYNWLVSGAPGTGKSYFLDRECEKLIFNEKTLSEKVEDLVNSDASIVSNDEKRRTYKKQCEEEKKVYVSRVTFYEDYLYDSFVGCYKPIVDKNDTAIINYDGKSGDKIESKILYDFVPGPFIEAYVNAKNDAEHNYVLIIEELNRAKAASVFGDMFQLLDRENGVSVYYVTPSTELKKYLENNLDDSSNCDEIRLPQNLYIWATMNSADRGVFPIDSAFRRRWSYKWQNVYLPRQNGASISFFWNGRIESILFDEFREIINAKIGDEEDKYIGPYYFSDNELKAIDDCHYNIVSGIQSDNCSNPLISKLLLYLRQDIFRYNPDEIFYEGYTVSKIINEYSQDNGLDKILKIDIDSSLLTGSNVSGTASVSTGTPSIGATAVVGTMSVSTPLLDGDGGNDTVEVSNAPINITSVADKQSSDADESKE